jgi:transcriptional accessory protein Tex/SPT6
MTDHPIITTIAQELGLEAGQVARTVQLLDEDNTIPFIARYRKEVTGGLDEEQLRAIQARLKYLRNLEERKETVLKSIAEQGKLTPELEARIRAAMVLQEVEDLYLPYRPILRSDVLKMEDLREGMILQGTVRNVVDFGAFVDIGVKQDGLVHVSQMADHYVKNPLEVVSVGEVVNVKVISVDLERGRIGLSIRIT